MVLLNGASGVEELIHAGLVTGFAEELLPYQKSNGGAGTLRLFRAVSEGVFFLGWNKPLAGALSANGRRLLTQWVADALRNWVRDTAAHVTEHASASVAFANGFVPAGMKIEGVGELERLLSRWVEESNASTVGDVGVFGGSPVLVVKMGPHEFVLNRDTKRAAVQVFLAAAARVGGAEELRWQVTANTKGRFNRVSYRTDDEPTPGWYAYLRHPSSGPRDL